MLVRNSLYLLTERLTNALSSFLTMVIAANLLSLSAFGEYTYNTAIYGILAPLVFFGLHDLIIKRLVVAKHAASSNLATSTVIFNALLIRLCAFVLVVLALFVISTHKPVVSLILIVGLSACILQTFEAYNQAFQRNYITVLVRIFVVTVFSILKVYLLWNGDVGMNGILLLFVGEIFCYAALGFLFSIKLQIMGNLIDRRELKILISGSLFLLASSFAAILNLRIDQVMIAEYLGTDAVGQYSVGVRLIEFSVMFAAAIAAAYYPKLAAINQNDASFFAGLRMINRIIFGLATCFVVGLFFVGPFMIDLFFGAGFTDAKMVMLFLLPTLYFLFFSVVTAKWIVATGIYWYSLFSNSLGAVVNVMLNMLLLPMWGIKGAVLASLVSYFVSCWLALLIHPKTREYFREAYISRG